MAIYNIFDYYEKESAEKVFEHVRPRIDPDAFTTNRIDGTFIPDSGSIRDQIFSALAARFFFFLLLLADIIWGAWALTTGLVKLALCICTCFQSTRLIKSLSRSWLSVKRAIVCSIALTIAIFSPALGIMFSCMYFLMYDKNGVDEVVPASLRDQFKDLFPMA